MPSMRRRAIVLMASLPLLVAPFMTAGCGSPSADEPADAVAPSKVMDSPDEEGDAPVDAPEAADGDAPTESESPASGSYVTYDEYVANKAAFDSANVVLFFNAVWCSTCKEARDNIEADLASIPPDLAIVVVDFDSANDLRQKYGVTVQHTFVQVDADGNELAKWSGSVTPDEIAQNTV